MIHNVSEFKYLYGPVFSWRLGMSLGIDPLSDKSKICNMDCVYCQLGKTVRWSRTRENFVPAQDILDEIRALPEMAIDYITFSGRGEPTLAKNLGEMIAAIRALRREKIAVITNSILMTEADVRRDLALADFVLAKLDACDDESMRKVDKTRYGESFDGIVAGIRDFRREYKGKLALQIMFVEENKKSAEKIAAIARSIGADEVELNTPLRPSAARPLSEKELSTIKKYFSGLKARTVYEIERRTAVPLNERDTIKRHGNYKIVSTGKKKMPATVRQSTARKRGARL